MIAENLNSVFTVKPGFMIAEKSPNRNITILIHVAVWTMLFLSPFIFMPNTIDSGWFRFYISFCINQFFVMALFYLNYVYLINRFLFRKQTLNFIVTNLFVIISLLIVYYLIDRLFLRDGGHFGPDLRFGWLLMIMGDIIKYSLTAALSVAIKMTVRWYQTESERNEFEKVRVEAELKNLKSQLNPHFLFNTLNNIYSLIDINQENAQQAVHQLSKLLRYVLYDNNQNEVPIKYEIDFLNNYLKLVRLRFPSRVDIKFEIKGDNEEIPVAPLLFISLIENAFKHGISNKGNSFVHILLDISNKKEMILDVENSYYPKDDKDRSGSGIGIENLRKRLDLIYKGRYLFENRKIDDTYHVCLKIDY